LVDDLHKPLGQNIVRKRPSVLPFRMSRVIVGLLGLSLLAFLLWAVTAEDPLGGEPVAVVSVGSPVATPKSKEIPPPVEATKAEIPVRADNPPPAAAPSGKTVTIIDGSTGQKKEIVVPGK
jgi:hypothetical protein